MDREIVDQRIIYLKRVIADKEKTLLHVPEGKLHIVRRGGHSYYYHRKNPGDTNGEYIRQENIKLAFALAQKDYDLQVLKLARKELNQLQKLRNAIKVDADEYYKTLDLSHQDLIKPLALTDEQFVKQWLEAPYHQKPFDENAPCHHTLRGERMRSKSEVIIANALSRRNIPYRYECGVKIKRFGYYHPDFTALNVRKRQVYIWEHFGMMDDPVYCKNALRRVDDYEKNGYFPGKNLIITHETSDKPLQVTTIEKMINTYLV